MMRRLANRTPLLAGETLMSWTGRIARDEAGVEPFEFLDLVGISRADVVEARPEGLDRLAAVTGAARDLLESAAFRSVGDRVFDYRGERFQGAFAPRETITFCPACLIEDGCADNPSHGRRVGRLNWLFAPVRTCPVHGIALVRRHVTDAAERFQDMALVAPDDASLRGLVASAKRRAVSGLQTYVEQRLAGASGPAWLDAQPIDLAARSTAILGAMLAFGPKIDLTKLSEEEWDAAGVEGYAFTSEGEEGVRRALAELYGRFRKTSAKGGPRGIFGRLYEWLQFNRSGKPRGPIRDVTRAFILETMVIDRGTKLFGEVVPTQVRHSVASLAFQAGLHPRTLNRALVTSGLMPDGDPDRVDGMLSVEAVAGERLAKRLKDAVPVARLPELLNCKRLQAEALVRADLIARIGTGNSRSNTMLDMVSSGEVDDFLTRLHVRATEVTGLSAGMVSIVGRAKSSRWPMAEILPMLLEEPTVRVERLAGTAGLAAIHVDPRAIARLLDVQPIAGHLDITEAATRLGLRPTAVRVLTTERDPNGRPFLGATLSKVRNVERFSFEPVELDRFLADHIDLATLATLAAKRGIPARRLRFELSKVGIDPILPRKRLDRYLYLRADL